MSTVLRHGRHFTPQSREKIHVSFNRIQNLDNQMILSTATLFVSLASICSAEPLQFADDSERGRLTVREGETPVLTYNYGKQLKEGVHEKYTRSCYIHPLFDLGGRPLTDDFPKDHFHHRGVFWTWPLMKARGRNVQTWHPSPLRQHFVRWIKREAGEKGATLSVENEWKLDGKDKVASETATIRVYPSSGAGRSIDVELSFEAVGGPVELRGQKNKGYGGLCLRGSPDMKSASLITDTGPLKKDSTNRPFKWASLSTETRGVAIFVHPKHPDYAPAWLLRTSYAGILNVSWPGRKPHTLKPGIPLKLKYRVFIHGGKAKPQSVPQAFDRYLAESE